jgi:1-acyl-sn-glycerol-3-phosphate acyltransferase
LNVFLRYIFFLLVVRPLVLVIIGLRVQHRERLPVKGPAILVANHNSHMDALVLMSLFPLRTLRRLRPVAAADYFLKSPALSWFARRIMGIIPIPRKVVSSHDDPLAGVDAALSQGAMVILFPEGSRGEPERLSAFKTGVVHLAKRHPDVPVIPVFLHGLGKSLPKGEALLVPFFCDVLVGSPVSWTGDRNRFMGVLTDQMQVLAAEGQFPPWE